MTSSEDKIHYVECVLSHRGPKEPFQARHASLSSEEDDVRFRVVQRTRQVDGPSILALMLVNPDLADPSSMISTMT